MIVRLTNVAAQILEGSLRQSWRTWKTGTSGEKSKPKSLSGEKVSQAAAATGRRGEKSKVGVARLLPMALALQPGQQQKKDKNGQKKVKRVTKNFNEQAGSASPANDKWESNSVASSNSSHFDFSSNTGAPTPTKLLTFELLSSPDEVFSHIGIRESTPNEFVAL